jgi:hypothetical protein
MRVVMEQLGHSQVAADIYSHVVPEAQRYASERIGAVLF